MPLVLEKSKCKQQEQEIVILPQPKKENPFKLISCVTYPVVKWAGGKRQLLLALKENMPTSYNRYFEPFIGGGALFFDQKPKDAYISDINEELINLYTVIKNDVGGLIEDLETHKVNKDYFLDIRAVDREPSYKKWSAVRKASRFIYLNRTCFNGLYRVNSQGQFNVPYGDYTNPRLIDENNLYNCSRLLKNTQIECGSFTKILSEVQKGDFVYFDPPYAPISETSSFTSYTKEGFDNKMQEDLKTVCDELNKMGVYFLLSNSDTPYINDLYTGYTINKVFASRQINANASGRGKITEVLVRNY